MLFESPLHSFTVYRRKLTSNRFVHVFDYKSDAHQHFRTNYLCGVTTLTWVSRTDRHNSNSKHTHAQTLPDGKCIHALSKVHSYYSKSLPIAVLEWKCCVKADCSNQEIYHRTEKCFTFESIPISMHGLKLWFNSTLCSHPTHYYTPCNTLLRICIATTPKTRNKMNK